MQKVDSLNKSKHRYVVGSKEEREKKEEEEKRKKRKRGFCPFLFFVCAVT